MQQAQGQTRATLAQQALPWTSHRQQRPALLGDVYARASRLSGAYVSSFEMLSMHLHGERGAHRLA